MDSVESYSTVAQKLVLNEYLQTGVQATNLL